MKPHILVVEDDTIIAAELADRLTDLGYSVCAKTGTAENAVILAEGLRPDLVLMDIRLKAEMDGVEAAGIIRSNFDIPVIFLTAYADDDTLQRAKVASPYGYIIKPFEEREIHTAIEIGLHKHLLEQKLRESEQWLAATLHSIGDGLVATDRTGHITFLNRPAERLLGQREETLAGLQADDVLILVKGEGRIPQATPVGSVLQNGLPLDLVDHWLIGQDCESPIEGAITPIRDHRNQIWGAVVVLRDITTRKQEEQERERLQARLYQAQQSDALAAMAGSLAYQFNNLMTAIIASASLILADIPDGDGELREGVERIKWAGQTAASLLYQIVPQDGGWLDIRSTPGQGTTSRAYLPAICTQEAASPAGDRSDAGALTLPGTEARASAHQTAGAAPKRILLVEDDEPVQTAMASMLEAGGYSVVKASCAHVALELFESQGSAFDLLLSDVALPDKGGLDLADHCLSQQPELGVLFTSGYADERSCRSVINERGYHLLQKPFDLQELLAAVAQVMNGQ